MIKTLQRKFVITAMTAITGLILLLLGAINTANLVMIGQRLDHTLELLGNTGGDVDNLPPVQPRTPEGKPFPFEIPGAHRNDYDTFMASNYFVVRFNPNEDAVFVDVSRTSTVSEEDAVVLASQVRSNGLSQGKSGWLRYLVKEDFRQGITVVFLDTSGERGAFLQVLILSIGVGLSCWGLMLASVIFLSKRAIRPVAENTERQKQFVTNAGHEIKTPLAIIQSNTEAMELYNGENKWSRNIKEQTARLNGLVKELLLLARMDEGAAQSEFTDFSLSDLLSEVLEEFAQPMEAKGLAIHTNIVPEITIHADREQVRHLVSILLDNGVKYANDSGRIDISLEKSEGRVKLCLQNTCLAFPQVPPDKLFDRFYRADTART